MSWDTLLSQTPVPPAPVPTPTPSPSPAAEVELLKSQLEFLKDANNRLGQSFSYFITAMQFVLAFLAVLGAFIVYILGNNLKDARNLAQQQVRQEVSRQVAVLVKAEVEDVRRTLGRERVISTTTVDYYLPDVRSNPHTREFKGLEARGFQNVRFCKELAELRRAPGDVVVLDLENWMTSNGQKFPALVEEERENLAKAQIDPLLDILPDSTVLVVYIRQNLKYLYQVPKNRYILPANNPVTLVGNTADGAYVSFGDRTL